MPGLTLQAIVAIINSKIKQLEESTKSELVAKVVEGAGTIKASAERSVNAFIDVLSETF